MSFVAAAVIGSVGAVAAAGINAYGANAASDKQVAFGQQALGQQNALFNEGLSLNQPFINAGQGAASTLSSLLTPGPNQTNVLSQLPGFQFASDWGQKAVSNQATTTGLGGNALAAGAQFATGLAQQNFGQYAGELQNLTDTGARAAGTALGGAVQQGGVVGNTLTGIGNASAAGTLGTTNAIAGGIGGATNSGVNALLLSKLFPGGVGGSNATTLGNGIYTPSELNTIGNQTAGL